MTPPEPSTYTCQLPLATPAAAAKVHVQNWVSIETVARLMDGKFSDCYDDVSSTAGRRALARICFALVQVWLVDCRYDYEFKGAAPALRVSVHAYLTRAVRAGGHLRGARSAVTKADVDTMFFADPVARERGKVPRAPALLALSSRAMPLGAEDGRGPVLRVLLAAQPAQVGDGLLCSALLGTQSAASVRSLAFVREQDRTIHGLPGYPEVGARGGP